MTTSTNINSGGAAVLSVDEGQTLSGLAATLIAQSGVTAAAGGTLRIASVDTSTTSGFVSFDPATDTLSYTASGYVPGASPDSFVYVVTDGTTDWTEEASITVTEPTADAYLQTVTADPGASILRASGWSQRLVLDNAATCTLSGALGDDLVFAGSGADTIDLGGYDNTVYGGPGGDTIDAGLGSDTVVARNGDTCITAAGYDNTIDAGNGNDVVLGSLGNSTVTLGNGNDVVVLFGYNNVITIGDNGSNGGLVGKLSYVNAGAGSATVTVGNGTNIVLAGGYRDTVTTGNGENLVFATTKSGGLTAPDGLPASAAATEASEGNCTITLGNGDNWVYLQGWGNTVNDGAGTDAVWGGTGNDDFALNAGGGAVFIENFSLGNGDKIDLSRLLAGTTLKADLSNIGSFVQVVGHATDDAAFGIPSDGAINTQLVVTGVHGTAMVSLENTGSIGLGDLVSHQSFLFAPGG